MSSTNSEILANVIDIAKNKNVEADVILTQEEQLGLKADRGDLSEYKVTSSRCVGVRVVQGTQVGTSYSESVEPSSLETMVQTAIENAGYAKENPHEKICAEKQGLRERRQRIVAYRSILTRLPSSSSARNSSPTVRFPTFCDPETMSSRITPGATAT